MFGEVSALDEKGQAVTERLQQYVDLIAEGYNEEQAIIYAYGLPQGGRRERHAMLIKDIRSVLGASRIEELETENARLADQVRRLTRTT